MFHAKNHRKLWGLLENSWEIVRHCGFMETKIFLRRIFLKDEADIPNSCYACLYATETRAGRLTPKCSFCPLEVIPCGEANSIHRQLQRAIEHKDKPAYQKFCRLFKNAKIKEGVETDGTETNNPAAV